MVSSAAKNVSASRGLSRAWFRATLFQRYESAYEELGAIPVIPAIPAIPDHTCVVMSAAGMHGVAMQRRPDLITKIGVVILISTQIVWQHDKYSILASSPYWKILVRSVEPCLGGICGDAKNSFLLSRKLSRDLHNPSGRDDKIPYNIEAILVKCKGLKAIQARVFHPLP
jgi:hypothetical protein